MKTRQLMFTLTSLITLAASLTLNSFADDSAITEGKPTQPTSRIKMPEDTRNVPVTAIALTPDGSHVLTGTQAGISVYSWPSLERIDSLETTLEHIHDLSFSPNGTRLLIAGGSPAEVGVVETIDWTNRNVVNRCELHEDVVYRVAWSPDGNHWAAASADGTCSVIRAEHGVAQFRFPGHSKAVLSICYLPQGTLIASAGADHSVRLWSSSDGVLKRTLDNHVNTVNAVAVRPDPASDATVVIVTIGEDQTVRFWQPESGRLIRFAKLDSVPRSVAWSPSDKRVFVGCNDGQLRIVNFADAAISQPIAALPGRIHEVLVDPDRSLILVAGEGGLRTIPVDFE